MDGYHGNLNYQFIHSLSPLTYAGIVIRVADI